MRLPRLVLDTMRGAAGAALALAIGCGTDAAPPITPETQAPRTQAAPVAAPPVVAPAPPPTPATLTPVPAAPSDPTPPQAEPEPGTEPDGEEPPATEEALAASDVTPSTPSKQRRRRGRADQVGSVQGDGNLESPLGTVGIGHLGRDVHAGCGRG